MGRRSTSTTKSGKYMNPTDQARKEARRRELKKNKKQRQIVRDAVLRSKNVRELCDDLDRLEEMELGLREADVANEKAIKEKKKQTSDTLLKILKFYEKNDRHQYVEAKKLYEDSENKRRKLREEVFKPYVSVGQRELDNISLPDIPLPPEVPGIPALSDIPLPTERQPEPLPTGLVPPGPPPRPIPERARQISDFIVRPRTDDSLKGILKDPKQERNDSNEDSQLSSDSESDNGSDDEKEDIEKRAKKSVRFAPEEEDAPKTLDYVSEREKQQLGSLEPVLPPQPLQPPPLDLPPQHFPPALSYQSVGVLHPHPPGVLSNPPVMPVQLPPMQRDVFASAPPPPQPPPPPSHGQLQFAPGRAPPHLPHMILAPPVPPFGRETHPPPPVLPGMTVQPTHPAQPTAVLSAPPQLTGASESTGKDGAIISAEPQLRNTQAEVTKFMPTSLRVRRDQPRAAKPKPTQSVPIRRLKTGQAIANSVTKDDAYAQFMKEMEGLM